MRVDPANSGAKQPMPIQEDENFILVRRDCQRQLLKLTEDLVSGPEIAASYLANDERVHKNLAIEQCLSQSSAPMAKMIHPHRGIG